MTTTYNADLPSGWQDMRSAELESLASIWLERKKELKNSLGLKNFEERLVRQWALETAVSAKLIQVDPGISPDLIQEDFSPQNIPFGKTDKPADEVVRILCDSETTFSWFKAHAIQNKPIDIEFVKALHYKMSNIDFKQMEPASEAVLQALLEMHSLHGKQNVFPEVESSWIYHRITQLRPFPDGNGRLARALASMVFLRAGLLPLVFPEDSQQSLMVAIRQADKGDLRELVALFAESQKVLLLKSFSVYEDMLPGKGEIEIIVKSAAQRILARRETHNKEYDRVIHIAEKLESVALENIKETALILNRELSSANKSYWAQASHSEENGLEWYHTQMTQLARKLDYFADQHAYRSWVSLRINEERYTEKKYAELVILFHALGVRFVGILAASAFIEYYDKHASNNVFRVDGPYPLNEQVFEFSYKEPEQVILQRFEIWLNQVLVAGLEHWRRQI